jgi:hypothetical protein
MLDKVKRHIPATSTINTIKFTNYIWFRISNMIMAMPLH